MSTSSRGSPVQRYKFDDALPPLAMLAGNEFVRASDYDALLNEHNGLRLLVERAILVLDSAGDALGKFNGYEAERCWPMAVALRAALSLRAGDGHGQT